MLSIFHVINAVIKLFQERKKKKRGIPCLLFVKKIKEKKLTRLPTDTSPFY